MFLLCKHISCFDWNKSGISCIETRRRLIFQPCCIYFTSFFLLFLFFFTITLLENVVSTFNLSVFSSFLYDASSIYMRGDLHASLAEATPNDNPFVFYSSSSLRSMFCVFDFAFLMLFSPSLALPPLTIKNFFLHHTPEKEK